VVFSGVKVYIRHGPIPSWDKPVMVRLKSLVTRHISIGLPRKVDMGLEEAMTGGVLSVRRSWTKKFDEGCHNEDSAIRVYL